jgi:uncharacterized membrane protein YeaQ/YmgE (transglycosylase-associated protein family)
MSIVGMLIMIVLAAVCGALGQALVRRSLGGWLVTILVGFIGALLGMWLANALGLPMLLAIPVEGQTFPVIWAVVGSAILALVPDVVQWVRNQLKR